MLRSRAIGIPCGQLMWTCVIPVGLFVGKLTENGHHFCASCPRTALWGDMLCQQKLQLLNFSCPYMSAHIFEVFQVDHWIDVPELVLLYWSVVVTGMGHGFFLSRPMPDALVHIICLVLSEEVAACHSKGMLDWRDWGLYCPLLWDVEQNRLCVVQGKSNVFDSNSFHGQAPGPPYPSRKNCMPRNCVWKGKKVWLFLGQLLKSCFFFMIRSVKVDLCPKSNYCVLTETPHSVSHCAAET